MQSKKKILSFLLKAILIYGIFSFPSSWIDNEYGIFYRKIGKVFFNRFSGTGFAIFSETKRPNFTKIAIGNRKLIGKDKKTEVETDELNTRLRGYLPTLLLISLIFASPVPTKSKFYAFAAGFIIIMAFIIFKQWIHCLEMAAEYQKLKITDISGTTRKLVSFLNKSIVISLSPSYTFAVFTWLLVTFRKNDLFTGFSIKER
jgi:hypothetical protein